MSRGASVDTHAHTREALSCKQDAGREAPGADKARASRVSRAVGHRRGLGAGQHTTMWLVAERGRVGVGEWGKSEIETNTAHDENENNEERIQHCTRQKQQLSRNAAIVFGGCRKEKTTSAAPAQYLFSADIG